MNAYVQMIRERVTGAAKMEAYAQLAASARLGHDISPLAFYSGMDVLAGPVYISLGGFRRPSIAA